MAGLEYLQSNDGSAPPTLVQAMVLNGDIDRESYSLYLNDQANGNGVIIFGGVDTTKYTGDLVALQVLPTNNGYSRYSAFNVALTGISIQDDSGTRLLTDDNWQTPALLDSGTTITYLPPVVFNAIIHRLRRLLLRPPLLLRFVFCSPNLPLRRALRPLHPRPPSLPCSTSPPPPTTTAPTPATSTSTPIPTAKPP